MDNEGFIDIANGKIWYKKVGLPNENAALIIVHGGPGLPHNYLEPLNPLGDERAVIFYDQLGCGKSDWPDNTSLWTVDRFADELINLIDFFSFDKYFILGQSWGAAIATTYALRQPDGLKGIILADPYLSTRIWMEDAERLISKLPRNLKDCILKFNNGKTYDPNEFKAATKKYYDDYIQRYEPTPESLKNSWKGMNHSIYQKMWGGQEFLISGSLKNFDLTKRLNEILIPALIICGRYDEATPEAATFFANSLKNAKVEVFENSAHFPFYNEPDKFIKTVNEFLLNN